MFLIHPVFCHRCFEYRFRNILSRSTEQHRAKKEVEIAVDCRRKTVVNQASEYLGAEKCTFLSYLFLQYKLVSHINVQYSKKKDQTFLFRSSEGGETSQSSEERGYSIRFAGHRNSDTVKQVCFAHSRSMHQF